MKNNTYQSQDRGNVTEYQKYLAAMDAVSVEKVASASVFFDPKPGNTIVDVGMASGTSTQILALLFPKLRIIGVDINQTMVDIAAKNYNLPNIEFRLDDGELLNTFHKETVSGFFNCSSIHHITSFNNYNSNRAFNTIKRQKELLTEGGIIVIRDFVKPPEKEVLLELMNTSSSSIPSDAELLLDFSKKARSLSKDNEKGFPISEVKSTKKDSRCFKLFYADAVEFIRRKDYYENWEIELQEEYGYFTQKEFEDIFKSLGLRIIVSNPIYNPWIIRNRYRDKFTLYDLSMKDLGFPPSNYLIAAEKIKNKGTSLSLTRHLPEHKPSFLNFSSYKNKQTGKLYDVVQRPNSVADIIPYTLSSGEIEILAKHGYPRPLSNIPAGSPVIDHKYFSGYINEGITASDNKPIDEILVERTGISRNNIRKIEKSLEYFTSPGGIDEKVESHFVELSSWEDTVSTSSTNFSGFKNQGMLRKFDAIQLLKTAQTGALVEARLELNIYNLLKKHSIDFPKWMGDKLEINELNISESKLTDILSEKAALFEPSEKKADYLRKHRAIFTEQGVQESSNILEYVTPQNFSINTLVTLPVTFFNDEYFIGLETRNLPVPQIESGNSKILVAPAKRLTNEISNFKELENYLSDLSFGEAKVTSFFKLGEKFFPSVGVTPEQVYPYVVCIDKPTNSLNWIKLKDIFNNLEKIKDGHLLIAVMRLVNAL